jgi:hypothetical protein
MSCCFVYAGYGVFMELSNVFMKEELNIRDVWAITTFVDDVFVWCR